MLGMFQDARKIEHFLAVNVDITKERTTQLAFLKDITKLERLDRKSGKWESLLLESSKGRATTAVKLPPGGGDLFRVVRAK